MGSLLPGWDERAPGCTPKEFQDFNENEDENQGYFAAYAQMKKAQKEAGEPTSPLPIGRRNSSLSRRSAEPRLLSPSASMPRSSFSGRDWAPMTPQSARSLSQAETMAAGRAGSALGGGPPALQRMYSVPMTRGERTDVLAGLVPASPPALSSRSSLDAYRTQPLAAKDKAADYQWWRHFDSAAMNERPDEPVDKEKAYKPQFGVIEHFHQETEDHHTGPAIIPAH